MVDPDDKERLRRLEARIDALKADHAPKPNVQSGGVGGAELAWRMVIELVAGIGIGFGIGYGLDVLFGTLPILLVVFTLLGFAAGVQTMMRSARAAQAAQEEHAAAQAAHHEQAAKAAGDDTGHRLPDEDEDNARGD